MYSLSLDELGKRARDKGIPFSGMFELTAKCNLRCRFCYVSDRGEIPENSPEKPTEEWMDIIRQAADAGMLRCAFTGGEPFMRDDFEEIYCRAYDLGLRISILTNGILIGDRQRTYLSKRIPDLISISLYGASAKTYQTVCGDGNNYRRVMTSLEGLHRAGLAFEIKVLAMHPLIGEYEALGRIAAGYQCPGKIDAYMGPGRDDPDRLMQEWRLSPSRIKEVIHSFKGSLPYEDDIPEKEHDSDGVGSNNNGTFLCGAGKDGFIITYDGRMLGCPALACFSTYPFLDGFNKAWSSLKQMIHHSEACEECLTCRECERCFICPADRLSETGSITCCSPYLAEMVHSLA